MASTQSYWYAAASKLVPAARWSLAVPKAAHLLVVVENDNHVAVQESSMVHGFVCHTASDSTITNDRYNVILLALDVPANCHAQTCADAGAAVARTKGIVLAL